jgi:hypothetical protein
MSCWLAVLAMLALEMVGLRRLCTDAQGHFASRRPQERRLPALPNILMG